MDVSLDEDFLNFESVSQTCGSMSFVAGVDEELIILDKELTRREQQCRDANEPETNKKQTRTVFFGDGSRMLGRGRKSFDDAEMKCILTENRVIAKFPLNGVGKGLTMLPIRYKLKEERRKVLKMSVNKLRGIDDPESWLCRSVLINNTMKKLQRETRDEKFNKNTRAGESARVSCDRVVQPEKRDPSRCGTCDCSVSSLIGKRVQDCEHCPTNTSDEPRKHGEARRDASTPSDVQKQTLCGGGTRQRVQFQEFEREIASASESRFSEEETEEAAAGSEEADEGGVHDVLSQLYMPPTPRMVTSIDSDTDEEEVGPAAGAASPNVSSAKRTIEEDESVGSPGKRQKSEDTLGFSLYETLLCRESIAARDVGVDRDAAKEKATTGRFHEDNCDSQYSCGHSVTMFGAEFQTVTFHNLIAGLET